MVQLKIPLSLSEGDGNKPPQSMYTSLALGLFGLRAIETQETQEKLFTSSSLNIKFINFPFVMEIAA